MHVLWLLASRSSASSRLRGALTAGAIALGVGALLATQTLIAATSATLARVAGDVAASSDIELRAPLEAGFPPDAGERLASVEEVQAVWPLVRKRTFLRAGQVRTFVELTGLDLPAGAEPRGLSLRSGRWPIESESGVALRASWAAENGLALGSRVELVTSGGLRSFEVVGLAAYPSYAEGAFDGEVVVPLGTARRLFGLGQGATNLSIRLTSPEARGRVEERAARLFPAGFVVLDPAQQALALRVAADELMAGLGLFGAAALCVGALLIFNTAEMTVHGQRREIGLLRAAGATRLQVLALVLLQGLLVAGAGSLLGVLFGGLLSAAILAAGPLGGAGLLPSLDVGAVFGPISLASVLVGMAVALAATLPAAWQAAGLPPVEALRGPGRARSTASARPGWLGMVAALAAVPFRWVLGSGAVLAQANVRLATRRGALTIAGVAIGVAFLLGLSTLAASATAVGQDRATRLFPGSLVVVSPVPQPEALLELFRREPGVASVAGLRVLSIASGDTWLDAMAVDPEPYLGERGAAFELVEGERGRVVQELAAGRAVLVPARLARLLELRMGSSLPLAAAQGPVEFRVAGVVKESFPSADGLGRLVISRADAAALFGAEGVSHLVVGVADGTPAAELEARLARLAERFGMQLTRVDDLRAGIAEDVGWLLAPLQGLVAVGFLVAALAVVNTMAANVAERRTEIGVLRALGAERGQLVAMVLAEAGVLGLLGGLLGAVLGLASGAVLVGLMRTADFDPPIVLPWLITLVAIIGAVLLALAAAAAPARSAIASSGRFSTPGVE